MKRLRVFGAVLLCVSACDQALSPPPAPSRDIDVVALERAVAWPDRSVGTVVTLANIYMAKNMSAQGLTYFEARSNDEPDNGVFRAYAGVFRAQSALQQPLLGRVDWVNEAIDGLDAAVEDDENLPRFLRAVTLSRLPERFEVANEAIDELDDLLRDEGSFIFSDNVTEQTRQALLRQGWQAMAKAAETAGRESLAAEAWDLAATRTRSPNDVLIGTNYSVDAAAGFRFGRPNVAEPRPGVFVARGFDFGDIAFVQTDDGLVAIDAGTHPQNAVDALAAVRELGAEGSVQTVFVTHAHWDHIGGLQGLVEPGTEVIAQARFDDELAIVNEAALDYTWFFGEETARSEPYGPLYDVQPDRLIADTETLTRGGVEFRLHALPGGETEDALLIEMPEEGIVFVGDSFMPYLGAPFVGEGSADGLLDTIDFLQTLEPDLLVHGHPPLTDLYTADILAPLSSALAYAYTQTTRGIIDRIPIAEIVQQDPMPDQLRDHPAAVVPFFVIRQQFMQRLHRARTGYWQPEGEGLVLVSEDQWAEVMDQLAGGDEEAWVAVITGAVTRGDHEVAWRLSDRGLRRHPDSVVLEALRTRALGGLRMKYQQFNPFKFIVFSELADQATAPLECGGPQC